MTTILYILTITCLLIPAIEDVRSRSINWFWIPFVLVCSVLLSYTINESFYTPLWNVFHNGIILLVLLLGAKLYVSIRNREVSKLIDNYLGLGDILMILAFSSLLKPYYFIFFLTSALLLTLVAYSILFLINKKKHSLIPLVTYLNGSLILLLSFDYFLLNHFLLLQY